MTVSSQTSEISYAGNGVTLAFTIPFYFLANADIQVTTRDSVGNFTTLSSGFSITGAGVPAGGTLTFLVAPASGVTVIIQRVPQFLQQTDYVSNDNFPAESHERALDRDVMISQRLAQQILRCLRTADGDATVGVPMTLPARATRAGKLLAFAVGSGDPEMFTPTALAGITQSLIGSVLFPQTAGEVAAGVTPTNFAYEPGDVRRYGYVADGVDGTDTGTNNATAIQNCINSNVITDLPEGVAIFTGSLTLPVGKTIRGKGPRKTTLRQISTAITAGIIFGDVVSSDISDGAHGVRDLCLKVAANAAAHGIRIGDGATAMSASMLDFSNLRIWSQQQETHGAPPVAVIAGQRGIYIQSAASAVFVANLRNVEIRAFDVGIDAAGSPVGANEWAFFTCWVLDCRLAVRLSNCSTWNLGGITVESSCANARALYTLNSVSNITWVGGRWEMPQANSYGVEGDATTTGQNWRISGVTVLINSDGTAIPGRKWTGTLPNDFVFAGYDTTGPFMMIPNVATALRLPRSIKIGGQNLGNGLLTIDRDLGGAPATATVAADGFLDVDGLNGVRARVTGVTTLELDGSAVAGQTRLRIFDVDNNALERVTVGAADSGGAGFKLLRIPN